MIDKIVVISDSEALVVFTNSPPKRLTSAPGEINTFVAWFLAPAVTLTFAEYKSAVSYGDDTAVIEFKEAA